MPIRRLVPIVLLACATVAHANSSLELGYPPTIELVPATTFDMSGTVVGHSEFSFDTLDNGHLVMKVVMRITGGAENRIRAELEPLQVESGTPPRLRILSETSQSFTSEGKPMTLLAIDHTQGSATCTPPPEAGGEKVTLPLPDDDRVVNVPMNLLFLPLARGEVERVQFQLFVCRGGPRFYDFVALTSGPPRQSGERSIVEIRYGPDLGNMMSWVASRLLPKLTFWLDASQNGEYIGHRMPLYSKGPEVLMLRSGILPSSLGPPF